MKAVVFHAIGDIRLENVPDPKIETPNDAVVHLTASAICGTDLHFIRGTVGPMKDGIVLGHEGVGIVEEAGPAVRNFKKGDRVVVPSTIACGNCSYCRAGYYAQCDRANPMGPEKGTAFYGGPVNSGSFNGMQAEFVRVPFANINLVKLPDEVDDDQAITLSDIFPTGYMAAEIADIKPGHTVVVFGCGPVGQFAIASAKLLDAGRIFAVDTYASRLKMAAAQGAEVLDFNVEDPIEALQQFTGGIGPDRVIDCVGVDAVCPSHGPAAKKAIAKKPIFAVERKMIAPKTNPDGDNWVPGDAPSQVLSWGVEACAKAGTMSIIGVYPEQAQSFPIGKAMNKNLTLKMGNCNHRKYIPKLIELVRSNVIDPAEVLTNAEPLTSAIDAFKHFDRRDAGWVKVKLEPEAEEQAA